jgi:hypothetical protein
MNMVDGFHIHIQNRTMEPFVIALSGAGSGLWRRVSCMWGRWYGQCKQCTI